MFFPARKPKYTLLLVGKSFAARFDLVEKRGALRIDALWSDRFDSGSSLSEAVSLLLKQFPKRLGRTCVVSSEFWTDILSIPADVVSIASGPELNRALAIDAEIDSNIPAFESQVSFQRVDNQNHINPQFCTTQIGNSTIVELSNLVRSHGAKLWALAHPLAFELLPEGTNPLQAASERLKWWNEEDTDYEPRITEFAERAREHLQKNQSLPVLCLATNRADSTSRSKAFSLATAVLTVGACACWNYQFRQKIHSITQINDRMEKESRSCDETLAAIKKTESRLVSLRKESVETNQTLHELTSKIQLANSVQQQQNARWGALLDALAVEAANCWVQQIIADGNNTTIKGIALSNADAHHFAAMLETSLRDDGWVLSPAATKKLIVEDLFEFSITLRYSVHSQTQTSESNEIVFNRKMANELDLATTAFKERLP